MPAANKTWRVIGFDDAPSRNGDEFVQVAGAVCADTRFEGMVWGKTVRDGFGATDLLSGLLLGGKYHRQLHAVLIDGIAFGGLAVVDLAELHKRLELPCLTVMRRLPDMVAMERAIRYLPEPDRRLEIIARAGEIHERPPFYYQVAGLEPDDAHRLLLRVTDTGHVPEPLRLAHLIGSAVIDGESRGRA